MYITSHIRTYLLTRLAILSPGKSCSSASLPGKFFSLLRQKFYCFLSFKAGTKIIFDNALALTGGREACIYLVKYYFYKRNKDILFRTWNFPIYHFCKLLRILLQNLNFLCISKTDSICLLRGPQNGHFLNFKMADLRPGNPK